MPARFIPTPVTTLPDGSLDPTVELTFTQAANLCGVRTHTVQRRHRSGLFPNAHKIAGDLQGRWLVPIGDLAVAGLLDPSQLGDPAARTPAEAAADAVVLARVTAELEGLREAYEARGETIEAQRMALEVYRAMLAELRDAA